MAKYGWPRKFIAMIRQFHDSMLARVQDKGETSAVSNGVKQGCVLALTMGSLTFSTMLTDTVRELNVGIGISYRYDESLFNLRRPQATTKVSTDTINVFRFADHCALDVASEGDKQHSVGKFCDACNNFGLTICTMKTEVMHQQTPRKPYIEPIIYVIVQRLQLSGQVHVSGQYTSPHSCYRRRN